MNNKKVAFQSPKVSDLLDVNTTRTLKLKFNDPNAKVANWLITPSMTDKRNARFRKATTDIVNGSATNDLLIGGSLEPKLLISVFTESSSQDPDHNCALYEIADASIVWSVDKRYSVPTGIGNPLFDPSDSSKIITITATVYNKKEIAVNYPLKFTAQSTPPTAVYDKYNKQLPFDHLKKAYTISTDSSGQVVIKISNAAPSILELNISGFNRSIIESYYVLFTNIGGLGGIIVTENTLPAPSLPTALTDGVFDLDQIIGSSVEITIPKITKFSNSPKIAIWINSEIATIADYIPIKGTESYKFNIDKRFFKINNSSNNLAYVISDNYANGYESEILNFKASGQLMQYVPNSEGNLKAPRLTIPGNFINYAQIIGGLQLDIPSYEGIAVDDTVTVGIYLNGYFPDSDAPKSARFTVIYTVTEDDLDNGFTVEFKQADVEGFDKSKSGQEGVFQSQYSVPTRGFSKILTLPLNDVQP